VDHNFSVKQELWQIGEKRTIDRILKGGVTNHTNKESICLTVLTRDWGWRNTGGRTGRDERERYEHREKVRRQRAK
jgi:hypothetical protein